MSLSLSMRGFQSSSTQDWMERTQRSLPLAVAAVFAIAIAWQLVQLVWLLLEPAPQPAPIAPPPPSAMTRRNTVDVQSIVSANLFGARPQAVQSAENAPQSQTNLVLAGTWASEDPSKGYAFIGESANSARMYAVGKPVRAGTSLHEVYPDRVILNNGGRYESLVLPRFGGGSGARPMAALPPRPVANQFAQNVRQIAETNPGAFAEIVRPQPVFANGTQRGYRVYPGRNRQQFAKLGLQPGDLVLAVNGTALDDPQRGMEIFNTMGASDRVTLTVERNGRSQELSLNTAQVNLPDVNAPARNGAPGTSPDGAPEE